MLPSFHTRLFDAGDCSLIKPTPMETTDAIPAKIHTVML